MPIADDYRFSSLNRSLHLLTLKFLVMKKEKNLRVNSKWRSLSKITSMILFFGVLFVSAFIFSSCTKKGCTSTCATNYDSKAKKMMVHAEVVPIKKPIIIVQMQTTLIKVALVEGMDFCRHRTNRILLYKRL